MKYNPYSASSLGVFEQCPRKFKYQKIDKIPVEFVKTDALIKGTLIHLLLEYNELSTKDKVQKIKNLKNSKEYKNVHISNELIKESFSIYNNFKKNNLHKELFSKKSLGKEIPCALKIENKSLVPCNFFDKDIIYRGYIDAVFVDEETNIVYIVDWKTGKDKSTGDYKQTPDQLIYYAAWYFSKFPIDTIKVKYIFVEHGTELEYTMTKDRLPYYNKMLLSNISKIEKCQDFEKNETSLCDWCDFQDYCIKDK